jgi:hypothetical protein
MPMATLTEVNLADAFRSKAVSQINYKSYLDPPSGAKGDGCERRSPACVFSSQWLI